MIFGYHGNYILIDLSTRRIERKTLHLNILRSYIGGVGLGSYILMQESTAGYNPLSPEAPIVFVTSPLVGTPLTTSAKFAIIAKSPLTGRICDAMSSSRFAIMAKRLGTDAICLKGRAEFHSIVFLEATDEYGLKLNFIPSFDFMSQSAKMTEKKIHDNFGSKWQIASTGLSGEKQIPFATISHDGRHAGRGGLGAVLGSKLIKALALYGEIPFKVFDHHKTTEIAKSLSQRSLGPDTAKYRELGTVSNLLVFNRLGVLPTRNFQFTSSDEASRLVPEDLAPARKIARNSCASCTIGCEHIFQNKSDENLPEANSGVRLEYESLFALGPLCGIHDPEQVLNSAKLCDEYGIDTISTGGTIAFLMECIDKGFLDARLNNNINELHFGNAEAVIRLIHEMHEDTPGTLASLLRIGSRRAAKLIGHNSISFANQIKGLEIPGYHPARLHAMALGMAVGTRGADHNRSGAYEVDFSNHSLEEREIASAVAAKEDYSAVMDSLILCKFLRGIFHDFYSEASQMLQAVTGIPFNSAELKSAGERIVLLRRAFNQREGWQPQEDNLPDSIFKQGEHETGSLTTQRFQKLKSSYYQVRSLTETGYLENSIYHNLIKNLIR